MVIRRWEHGARSRERRARGQAVRGRTRQRNNAGHQFIAIPQVIEVIIYGNDGQSQGKVPGYDT